MKKIKLWPALIVVWLSLVVVVNGTLYYLANSNPFYFVEKNYYQSSLKYDSIIEAKKLTKKNNWQLNHHLISGNDKSTLYFSLKNNEGSIKNLSGMLLAYRPSNSGLDQTKQVEFNKTELGDYKVDLSKLKKGAWKFTLKLHLKDKINLKEPKKIAYYKTIAINI